MVFGDLAANRVRPPVANPRRTYGEQRRPTGRTKIRGTHEHGTDNMIYVHKRTAEGFVEIAFAEVPRSRLKRSVIRLTRKQTRFSNLIWSS